MKNILPVLFLFVLCYSATNDTTIDSATLKRIFMGNYAYSTIISSAPKLTMRWASDLNRPVFKNRTGTAYKMLADASTSSNTPATRLFYADANGAAGSSANLTFDGTKLNIVGKLTTSDSINSGHIESSGRVTATDFQASDSIRGVTGSFTGRITGTDVQVSDSVKTVYISASDIKSAGITGTNLNATNYVEGPYFNALTWVHSPVVKSTRDTTSDQIVLDSLKAVTGDFTGRVTGTDVQVSDSIIAGTIKSNVKIVADTIRSIGNSDEYIALGLDPDYGYGIRMNTNQLRVSNDILTPKISFGTLGTNNQSIRLDGTNSIVIGKTATSLHDEQVIIKNLAPDSSIVVDGDSVSVRKLVARTKISADTLKANKINIGTDLNEPWHTSFNALQIGAGLSFFSPTTAGHGYLQSNAYVNASSQFISRYTGGSVHQSIIYDAVSWNIAPSVPAGNVLTYTEKMKLDSTGLAVNGDIIADKITTKKQIVLGNLQTVHTVNGSNYINVDTLTSNNIELTDDDNLAAIGFTGTIGTVFYVRTGTVNVVLISPHISVYARVTSLSPQKYYQITIADNNELLIFASP